jgi:hypothetical protein
LVFPKSLLLPHSNNYAEATEERGSYPTNYSQYNVGRSGGDGPLDHKPVLDSPRITESVFKHDINHIDEHGKMA